jgi:phosphopantetheine adenylyltransferase
MAAATASAAALLLLPTPTSPASLRTRFHPTLASVLPSLVASAKGGGKAAQLDVGIVLPKTFPTRLSPRASVFPRIQELVKDLYTLISTAATGAGVQLDAAGGVDARVFMFEDQSGHPADLPQVAHSYSGPIIDLSILASSDRHYHRIFSVESEDGEGVLRAYLDAHRAQNISPPTNILRVKVGETEKASKSPIPELRKADAAHKSVVVGGTFGPLQSSDKALLTAAAVVVEPETEDILSPNRRRITIGIAADADKSWDERQEAVADFFESIVAFARRVKTSRAVEHKTGPSGKVVSVRVGPTLTIDYVEMSDVAGLATSDESISALVVSKGKGVDAKVVNDKRKEKGWRPVEVYEV